MPERTITEAVLAEHDALREFEAWTGTSAWRSRVQTLLDDDAAMCARVRELERVIADALHCLTAEDQRNGALHARAHLRAAINPGGADA